MASILFSIFLACFPMSGIIINLIKEVKSMEWIKRWLRLRREEQEALVALEVKRIDKDRQESKEKCDNFMRAMFSLNCPFNDEKCNSGCVHFIGGRVYELPDPYNGNFVTYNLPKCLLWNKK